MIAAAFWSVTLGIVAVALLASVLVGAITLFSGLVNVNRTWAPIVGLLVMVVAGAACMGGCVALGSVAWP